MALRTKRHGVRAIPRASLEAFKVKLARGPKPNGSESSDATIFDGWRGAIFWMVVDRHR